MPVPRTEVVAATVGAEIMVLGGFTADRGASRRADAYSPSLDRWRRLPDLPVGIHHAMAVGSGGKLYVLGGYTVAGAPLRQFLVLERGRWRALAKMPFPRAAAGAGVAGTHVVVAGGIAPEAASRATRSRTTSAQGAGRSSRDRRRASIWASQRSERRSTQWPVAPPASTRTFSTSRATAPAIAAGGACSRCLIRVAARARSASGVRSCPSAARSPAARSPRCSPIESRTADGCGWPTCRRRGTVSESRLWADGSSSSAAGRARPHGQRGERGARRAELAARLPAEREYRLDRRTEPTKIAPVRAHRPKFDRPALAVASVRESTVGQPGGV